MSQVEAETVHQPIVPSLLPGEQLNGVHYFHWDSPSRPWNCAMKLTLCSKPMITVAKGTTTVASTDERLILSSSQTDEVFCCCLPIARFSSGSSFQFFPQFVSSADKTHTSSSCFFCQLNMEEATLRSSTSTIQVHVEGKGISKERQMGAPSFWTNIRGVPKFTVKKEAAGEALTTIFQAPQPYRHLQEAVIGKLPEPMGMRSGSS